MIINLAISFDKNYLNQFYVLIESIFRNNENVPFCFHCIIKDDVSHDEKEKINHYISSKGSQLIQYQVDESLLSKFVVSGSWTSSVYYKMFFPLLVSKDIKSLIYLDTDMVVIGSLKPLAETNLGNYPVGAVYDEYVKTQPLIGIHEEGQYFNSGMLFYNLELWRSMQISEKAIQYLTDFPQNIKYVDQCALNAVIQGNWLHIEMKYNWIYTYVPQGISKRQLLELSKDKVIIHYTLQRPWFLLCKSRLRLFYFQYFNLSPNVKSKAIIDFTYDKIPALLKRTLLEFYFDSYIIQKIWRFFKS